jgi:ATP-dependent exoDNAse (exonuclease V) beta subunit
VQDFARVYIRLCEERGLIDFTDILLRAYELLQQKGPREELQRQFKFVMLDEAQDTNQLQLDIVNVIAGDNLYQVGDVKQSIYRFHGTDPALIRAYHQEIEKQGGGLYDLDDNYRSARGVLSFANVLFGNDELLGHSAAALKAHHDNDFFQQAGECVQLLEIAAHNSKGKPDKSLARKEEARWIADRFLEMRKHRSSWSEFVVLVGSRPQAGELLQEFKQRGMPAKLVKGGGLFDNPMVKEARCFLEMLTKPRDPGTFLRLLLGNMGRVSDQGIYELACLRREAELDFLWDAALYILDEEHEQRAEQILSLESDRVALIGLVESIQDARSTLGVRPLSEILSRAFCRRDLDLYYLAGGSSAGAGQGAGLVGRQIYGGFQEFLRLVDDWQAAGKDPFSFSDELKRQEDLGFAPEEEAISVPEEECIVIDSVHSSKGKEFPIVALALTGSSEDKNDKTSYALHLSSEPGAQDEGVAQNSTLVLTSHKKLKPENYYSPRYEDLHAQHGEESRLETARLLYVGCTRAENQLLIAYNKNAKGGLSASMVRGIDQAQREMTALKEEGYLAHERIEK